MDPQWTGHVGPGSFVAGKVGAGYGEIVGTATFIDTVAVTEAFRSGGPVPESGTGSFEINR
ncbi:MAG: hypothetical protein WEB67_06835 [Acidimicrobiia bacterium]